MKYTLIYDNDKSLKWTKSFRNSICNDSSRYFV